jgi:hypothetical protein
MVRTQVYLTTEQHRALTTEARREGVSMTERLRRILAAHFEGRWGVAAIAKEDVLSFVGLGASGRAEVSERHDEALDEALRDAPLR